MFLLALLLFGVGMLLLGASWKQRHALGLPPGRIIALDGQGLQRVDAPLVDQRLGLTGMPDYLVRRRRMVIPVEVKSGAAPPQPYESHVLQLAAYCALVESEYGVRPAYGVIRYPERSFAIDYTRELERRLRAVVSAIQAAGDAAPTRSHQAAQRCGACGYQGLCDQRIASPARRERARI